MISVAQVLNFTVPLFMLSAHVIHYFILVGRRLGSLSPLDTLLTSIFAYNVLLTITTPLQRILYGRWHAHTLLHTAHMSLTSTTSATTLFAYPTLQQDPAIDQTFGSHISIAFLWLICAYLAMVHSHNWGKRAHRNMGYITLLSFTIHILSCFHIVYIDIVKHHALSRTVLLIGVVQSVRFMLAAVDSARRGDYPAHRLFVLRAFLYSSEGSGPTRHVEYMQWMFGKGALFCQQRN